MRKKVILAISDYANTGIGESLRPQLNHWHDQGHEVWLLGLGYNGWVSQVDRTMYPYAERLLTMLDGYDPQAKFGQSTILKAIEASKPNVIITSFDVGMIRYISEPHQDPITRRDKATFEALNSRTRSFNHLAYFPLDGLCADQTMPRHFEEMIAGMDTPVTYSDFAREAVLRTCGLDIPMIPICHDPRVYHPRNQKDALRAIGFPEDKFIISMIATNQSRKTWPTFMRAVGRVARRHSDVFVLPWTTWDVQINGGFDIADLIYRENMHLQTINPGAAVHRFTDDSMANLYNAIDVCVLTSVGEGAGLPPIRARACGTPALVSDNSSCTEFASDKFELLKSAPSHVDNGNNLQRYGTSIDELEEKLETLYANRGMLKELGRNAHLHSRRYEYSNILPQWDALLEGIS